MFGKPTRKTSQRPFGKTTRVTKASLRPSQLRDFETLEDRKLMSVSQMWFNGNTLCVKTDDVATSVEVRQFGSDIVIQDLSTARSWNFAASSVGTVEFQGGAGDDRFQNSVMNLPTRAFGLAATITWWATTRSTCSWGATGTTRSSAGAATTTCGVATAMTSSSAAMATTS